MNPTNLDYELTGNAAEAAKQAARRAGIDGLVLTHAPYTEVITEQTLRTVLIMPRLALSPDVTRIVGDLLAAGMTILTSRFDEDTRRWLITVNLDRGPAGRRRIAELAGAVVR